MASSAAVVAGAAVADGAVVGAAVGGVGDRGRRFSQIAK